MKELNDIEIIIIRSLDKTATEQELAVLYDWLKASTENKAQYYQIKDTWDAAGIITPDTASAWKQLNKQIDANKKMPRWIIETIKIAAVAVLVAVATYTVFKIPQKPPVEPAMAKVVVPNGSQSTVVLADGTTVRLNSGSELVYPSQFNSDVRKVELTGEGYFKVKHNTAHPFIVSAGEIDVKVLGTEFNVMAYPDLERIETTLVEGSVALNKRGTANGHIVLKPGEKAVFENDELVVTPADIELETTWTQKGFYFQSTSFEELVSRLERWYDVDIIIDDEDFIDITFTGKFRNKESIWQVLDVIKMTTPIDYKTKEGKIYITLINQ